jgi:glycosyltransferase involved in cell wall biosynthesis
MPPAPIVSVIVPTFDSARTVEATLASALGQTLADLEVVVVDDGSRDDTPARVEAVARRDPRVRLLVQPNRGVAAARNAAIAASRGAFVAPLDADDLWHPTKLARQLARFETAGPRTGLVYAWTTIVDEAGAPLAAAPAWRAEGAVLPLLLCHHFIGSASCPLIRREPLEAIGGYDASLLAAGAQGCEDWDLALRLAERCEFAVVPEYLVYYRRSPGSMSLRTDSVARSFEIVAGRLARAHPELPAVLFRWSRSHFHRYLADVCLRAGDPRGALRWNLRAFRADPLSLLSTELVARALACASDAVFGPEPTRRSPALRALSRALRPARARAVRAARDAASPEAPLPWECEPRSLYDRACARRWRLAERHARRAPAPAPLPAHAEA